MRDDATDRHASDCSSADVTRSRHRASARDRRDDAGNPEKSAASARRWFHPSALGDRRSLAMIVAVMLIIWGAGAATVALDTTTTGSAVTAVDQSVGIASEGTGISLSSGAEGTATLGDDDRRFQTSAEIYQGDRYEVQIDLKNPGEQGTAGRLVLEAPEPVELEVQSGEFTNFQASRLDNQTWMIEAPESVGASLTTTNPWTGPVCNPHSVRFNDTAGDAGGTNPGVETWNPTFEDDIIVHDVGGSGTISDSADPVLNDESVRNRDNCDPLLEPDAANLSAKAWYVDVDTSGTYTTGDEVFVDNDSDGNLTNQSDPLVGGTAPPAATVVTTANAQDTDWAIDSFDNSDGGSWDGQNDFLGIDDDGDQVYTSTGDTLINDEGTANRDVGDDLLGLGSSARFFDKDGSGDYSTGDEVYFDNDSDGVYTGQADTLVDGDGSSTTGSDAIEGSTSMTAGDALFDLESIYGSDNGLYFNDSNGDGHWNTSEDIILDPNRNSQNSNTYDANAGSDNDSDGTADDDVLIYTGADGTQVSDGDSITPFDSADDFALNDSDDDSDYDDGEDIVIDPHDGGTYSVGADTIVSQGDDGTKDVSDNDSASNNDLDETTFFVVDDDGDSIIDLGTEDDIVEDAGGSGTFSDSSDTSVGGTAPADGTAYNTDQFDPDWSLDSIDDSDGGSWDGNNDAIIIDVGDRGTYSAGADAAVSLGDDTDRDGADGTSLEDLDETTYLVVDDDRDGSIDLGTEDDIVTDDDLDWRYTARADRKLAGEVSLSTLNGKTITTTNPWDDPPDFHPDRPHGPNDPSVHHPVTFFDDGDGTWEPDRDSIYLDRWSEDRIVSYGPEDDILLAGTEYSDLTIVVALRDDGKPGFYTVEGRLRPTAR